MLVDHLKDGVKLIGLAEFLGGAAGFDGLYRVVQIGPTAAIEFFPAADRTKDQRVGMKPIKILPYRPGTINSMPVGGQEVISGEFTGCVMAVFPKDGMTHAGHVDTNPDTTQRAQWNALKAKVGKGKWLEFDTAGKMDNHPGGLTLDKIILCVATEEKIEHYFVRKHTMDYGPGRRSHLNPDNIIHDRTVVYTVLPSHGQ